MGRELSSTPGVPPQPPASRGTPPPMKGCIGRATARGRTALRKISPAISAAHRGRRLPPGSAAELGEVSHSAPRCCGAPLPRFPTPRVAPQGCRPAAPPGHAAPAAGPEPQPRCGCGAEHRPGSAGGSDTPPRARPRYTGPGPRVAASPRAGLLSAELGAGVRRPSPARPSVS